ncbi:cobalamin biosynthesis protein [Lusitaniella coriacea LEGE 07157]|uniref:Cobalamin biosynthesis protein CobD n=1 Tax=Lusitaniella coriacea LEGE 07157 TaxID=945747 RepID=A0A8J7DWK2_9CYAN|nr:adenosylcobinamide-phosphate synthase CbiB [Lusitaniella coriacea]MBE9116414.1 cobalamin biosynthesis protein [Lusitaniella coriacea LEGE 07157]
MEATIGSAILVLAAILDYWIGDPWGWLHPVQVMGWIISRYSDWVLEHFRGQRMRRIAGVLLGVGLILGSGLVGMGWIRGLSWIHPVLGAIAAIILLASCFAGRSLRRAAEDVLAPLEAGNLEGARSRLSQYVGRETQNLSESEILRAVLETVAENAIDGVTAPLFYGILGLLLFGSSGVALALAYKAASTLDSMVGYKTEPFADLGWFSAQLEDVLTLLPCRITVCAIALFSGKPRYVFQLCRRDASKDPSPNSGWSECAYAAALGVQLGGENVYGGIVKEKPRLGEPQKPITREVVEEALGLTRACVLLGLGVGIALSLICI